MRRPPRVAAAVVWSSLAASCPTEAPPPAAPTPRLDVVLGVGEVRCGPVTRDAELIGGPAAYAQVGRSFKCMNHRIRFVVQDGSRPTGNSSVGGDLIDVDRVRGDEHVEGRDFFREHATAFGGHEIAVEKIEVVNDGTNGAPGIIRVSGPAGPVTMAPGAVHLAQDMPARVQTDYVLAPDVDHVEIRTTIFNESDDQLPGVLYADFLAIGSQTPFTPEHGFGEAPIFGSATFLGQARGADVSYAFVCQDADPTLVVHDQAVSVTFCRDEPFIAKEATYSRFLVVGDGTVESVASRAYALRGIETGAVVGRVVDDAGAPVAGVLVAALRGAGADAVVANEARTDHEGRYRLTLRPGAYAVVAHDPARARREAVAVDVAADAEASVDARIGGGGRLQGAVSFVADGRPVAPRAAKWTIQALDAANEPLPGLASRPPTYAVTTDGVFDVALPAGRWRVWASKGFEWTRAEAEVIVVDGAAARLDATLAHVLDTTGLVAGEFHQHTLGSVDATVPLDVKVIENAAEGVELTASTDHDNVVDLGAVVDALGLRAQLLALSGNEVSYAGLAHFNVFPWAIDPADPYRDVGSRMWWQKTIPEVFADARAAAGGDPIVQVNHPRDGPYGYLGQMRLDPTDATRIARDPPTIATFPAAIYDAWAGDFHAIEVQKKVGDPSLYTDDGMIELARRARDDPFAVPPLADWFALMGAGLRVAAMGNSDSHHRNGGVGYPRSYLRVGFDDPARLTAADAQAAIRAQRVSVAEGCVAELLVAGGPGGGRPMGLDEAIDGALRDDVVVRVQAPPHVDVERLELYVNGRAQPLVVGGDVAVDAAGVLSAPLPEPALRTTAVRLQAPVVGLPDGDLVVVAMARGGGGLAPTGGGSTLCYTAPLYVDDGGDGWVGWLEDTQQVR